MSNLSTYLERSGIDRGEAAKAIGVSRVTLWRMAGGRMEPTRPVILKVLAFLNRPDVLAKMKRRRISFDEVFGAAPERTPRRAAA